MRELDRRLEQAVHRFADAVDTDVDAVAVAERVTATRRRPFGSVLGREVPVPVLLLVALGLLVLGMAWTLAIGAPREVRPATDDELDRSLVALGIPLPTFLPGTDATGDERTTARELPVRTTTPDGLRFDVAVDANDGRVTGLGRWAPARTSTDTVTGLAGIGPLAGPAHLDAPDGAWDGECTAASGPDLRAITGSCWLVGSGAYDGMTWYRQFTWRFDPSHGTAGGVSQGIVYPGEPPTP